MTDSNLTLEELRALVAERLLYTGRANTLLGDAFVLERMMAKFTDELLAQLWAEECERARQREDVALDLILDNMLVTFQFHFGIADKFHTPEEQALSDKIWDELEEAKGVEFEARLEAAAKQYAEDCEKYRKEDGSIPYFVTARYMAACEDPDDPNSPDWDAWKDQMKEASLGY